MKIGFLITARLKSSRLKEKILLNINGSTIIDHVIRRCKKVESINSIILCTSINSQDDRLVEKAKENKISIFRGSENDVLDRLLNAAKEYDLDGFISITADNPLFSYELGEFMFQTYKKESPDFIFANGMPMGTMPYFLDTKALEVACYMKKLADTEIWGPFVKRPEFFRIGEISVLNSPFKENIRITCDYPEDFSFIERIYSFFEENHVPGIKEVLTILNDHPQLLNINNMHIQRMPDKSTILKLENDFKEMIPFGSKYADKINKHLNPGSSKINFELKC